MSPPPSATKLAGCPAERGRYLGIQRALFLRNRDFTTSNGGRAEPRTNGQNAVRHAVLTYSTSLSRKRSGPCLVSPVASARAGQVAVEVD